MKCFLTALGMCALMACMTAPADTHVWNGAAGITTDWSAPANWANGAEPDANDDVTINDDSLQGTCTYDGAAAASSFDDLTIGDSMTLEVNEEDLTFQSCTVVGSWMHDGSENIDVTGEMYVQENATFTIDESLITSVGALTINADAEGSSRQLTLDDAGTLDVDGVTRLMGSTSTNSVEATLLISTGFHFLPHVIDLDGGNGATRRAVLDCNESVTATNLMTVDGYVGIDVLAGEKLSPLQILVGDRSSAASLQIGCSLGTGEVETSSLTMRSGDDAAEHAYVQLAYGTLDVNGDVELVASESVDAHAELEVSSSAIFEPNSIELRGHASDTDRYAMLDFNESVTVQNSGEIIAVGQATIDVDTGKTLSTGGLLLIGDSITDEHSNFTKSGAGTASAGTIRIESSSSTNTTVTVAGGTLGTI